MSNARSAGDSTGGFSIVGEDVLFEWGESSLKRLRVSTPEGDEVERNVVRHPGAVSVVPVLEDGNTVVMVRQYRSAVGKTLLELPAGTRDVPGEAPEETARRELLEEAGFRTNKLTKLCDFYNSPGSSDHHHFLYMAQDLVQDKRDSQGIEEVHMTIEHVRLTETAQLIASGVIADAKTIIGLLMARDALASAVLPGS